jgi:hypothetical protein
MVTADRSEIHFSLVIPRGGQKHELASLKKLDELIFIDPDKMMEFYSVWINVHDFVTVWTHVLEFSLIAYACYYNGEPLSGSPAMPEDKRDVINHFLRTQRTAQITLPLSKSSGTDADEEISELRESIQSMPMLALMDREPEPQSRFIDSKSMEDAALAQLSKLESSSDRQATVMSLVERFENVKQAHLRHQRCSDPKKIKVIQRKPAPVQPTSSVTQPIPEGVSHVASLSDDSSSEGEVA